MTTVFLNCSYADQYTYAYSIECIQESGKKNKYEFIYVYNLKLETKETANTIYPKRNFDNLLIVLKTLLKIRILRQTC